MSSWSRFLESESPSHRQVRETLSYLARDINSLGVYEFDLQQLEKLNIDVVPMTLDETSPHKPSYFAPHTGDMIPEPTKDNLGEAYTGFDDETEASFTGPADRAYWMGEHLSRYISYYIFRVSEESVPWISGE
ncbi:hypothetical protein N7535_000607 [Penicillium sp. DV-2018c]|nr:hypothetical protein N7461_006141 [Penicillium sp. DV-2018c]KAJ5581987.1 hypothetical protein N7535_000607 [Penicillium sp. DV-2018c]